MPRVQPAAYKRIATEEAWGTAELFAEWKKVLDAKYKQWQERLATEWGAILQLESAGRLPEILTYLRDASKRYAAAAETLHKRGLYAAAYHRMLTAWCHASAANQIYDVMTKATSGNSLATRRVMSSAAKASPEIIL